MFFGVAITLQEHADLMKPLCSRLKSFLFVVLYVATLGFGSNAPVLASLGGDQFDALSEKAIFFICIFISASIGQLIPLNCVSLRKKQWAVCTGLLDAVLS